MIVFLMTAEEVQDKNCRIEGLLATISNGNSQAIGELYDLIKTDVFAYALSKTGNKYDADDVVQDTFVQVYKHARQYKPKGKPLAWIVRIELNLIRRRYQLKAREAVFDDSFNNTPASENMEENVVRNVFLKELLSTLNEDEREVVTLHVVSGMRHREIAQLLEKPLSTVLSKYNRAIKKLQLVVKEK